MTITIDRRIENLQNTLKETKAAAVIIRTTKVSGGWHDVKFEARRAGFKTTRFFNPEYEAKHEFSECYKFSRI